VVSNETVIDEDSHPCNYSFDCPDYPHFECSPQSHLCEHKGIFPILGIEFLGVIVLTVVLALSNMGGIGGGGVVVPFTMTFFLFTTKEAIAISGFCIFCSAVVRYIY